MVKLRRRRLSKRTVDNLSVEDKDAVFWDSELQGFGVRVYPTGTKVYIVQTRSGGKSRRFTLGRHGVIGADEARHLAAHTIARVKQGEDPDLAPSGWAVDPARAPHRIAAQDRTADPLHHKVISSIVQRLDRAIMTDGHRQEYLVCLVAELLAPEWVSPWTMGHDWALWDLEHGSGARIQIKQSTARNPWDVGRQVDTRTCWFNIARPDLFMSPEGEYIEPPGSTCRDLHLRLARGDKRVGCRSPGAGAMEVPGAPGEKPSGELAQCRTPRPRGDHRCRRVRVACRDRAGNPRRIVSATPSAFAGARRLRIHGRIDST